MSAAAPTGQRVRAQALMELRLLVRNGESLLVSFGIPLGVLVFASKLAPVHLGPGRPLDTLVPAVLALSVMSTAFTSQAIQTGFQRKYAVLKRLGATPLTRTSFLAAKWLAVLVVVAVQAVLVLGLALVLGWAWPPGARVGLLLAGMVLGTAVFTALGLAMAGTLKAELTLALANAVFLVLAAVGALVFSTAGPNLVRQVAAATPSGALALLLGEALPLPGDGVLLAPLAAMILVGWLLLGSVIAARWFRWHP